MEFKCWPNWTTLFCLISLNNYLVHFKSREKRRLEIWLSDMANILVGVKVSDIKYSLVSWGNYSDGGPVNLGLHFPLITENTVVHWLSLFQPTHGSSSVLVPEQQQAWLWVWAAGGWGALCAGSEVCGWVFRLGSSDVNVAVTLLSVQSDSHSSLHFSTPIYTHYKHVLGAFCRFPSVPV